MRRYGIRTLFGVVLSSAISFWHYSNSIRTYHAEVSVVTDLPLVSEAREWCDPSAGSIICPPDSNIIEGIPTGGRYATEYCGPAVARHMVWLLGPRYGRRVTSVRLSGPIYRDTHLARVVELPHLSTLVLEDTSITKAWIERTRQRNPFLQLEVVTSGPYWRGSGAIQGR